MRNIKIFQMGPPNPELDLSKVVRMANASQNIFSFSLGDKLETIGPPNLEGQYKFSDLVKTLKDSRLEEDVNVFIGVIDFPIYDELFSSIDEGNLYIIISLYDIDGILERSRKNSNDYVLCEIGAQLLAIEERRAKDISIDPEEPGEPWHEETRACLFDYDKTRFYSYKKLMLPQLCSGCNALLEEANVGKSVQNASVNIVKAGIRPFKTTIIETFSNRMVLAGLVMVISGILFNSKYAPPLYYIISGRFSCSF